MADVVAVFAILGGLIELLAVVAGPQLATVATGSDAPLPGMDLIPLLVALAAAAIAFVGAGAVVIGRDGRRWGVALIGAAILGSLAAAPSTGFYVFGGVFVFIGGVMSLFVRGRRRVGRP